ncbi:MAG: acyl-CoA dehydrogenase [Candidatus Lokiarchaeota archaeon]|nr:acyl-CoA dehydrogenase [Candidatus Lokiarchaeota archaeon]MBD3199208.1 acyl-CoA dehydrogenase [Candidatus Lokiarchaeota archaeon]
MMKKMSESYFWWTEEQKKVAREVGQFVEENFTAAEEYYWKKEFPWHLVKRVAEKGYFGAGIPREYGGMELGATGSCIVAEELGRLYAVGHVFVVSMLAGLEQILKYATEEQKKKWLPKLAKGDELGAVCITEPFAGSDAANVMTTAEKDGDEWIINGKKRYITGAGVSDRYFIYAKTSEEKSDRKQYAHLTSFLVEKGTPGFSLERINPLIGFENVPNGYLSFEDVRIPDENRIGPVGKGWNVMMAGLNFERLIAGAVFVGTLKDIIKLLFHYTQRRVQFRRTTDRYQGNQNEIAEIISMYRMGRVFSYYCAKEIDDGKEPMINSSIAKMVISEYVRKAGQKAIQVMGGDGLTKFYFAERLMREGKIGEIVAGTTDIQKMIIYRFSSMLPDYNASMRMRWNEDINAPIISNADSKFKGFEVNEENILKVIAHDYKVNPGLYMTIDDIREDIGTGRSKTRKIVESLEEQGLVVTYRDRASNIKLVKATYVGLQKAFPKEYYEWYPEWYADADKF